ncbi:DUF4214 domain-containing protein [Burkholderia gladioli]|uniref:DUF4214 domain-containing protein n=1 Tax=Burkholderia gladioli TaxID=28095 RepID=UPI00163E2B1D|nr:DUF4214 domain-containing protein [Burkholderia gladioli]
MQSTEIAHFKNRLRQVVAHQADRILQLKFTGIDRSAHASEKKTRSPAADVDHIKQIAVELRDAVRLADSTSVELGQHAPPALPAISIPAHCDLAYPALPSYPSYEDFFNDDDEQFLRNVFAHLLHREPDDNGREHLLERLRSGVSQLEVLLHTWNSNERKQLGTQLANLPRAKRLLFFSTLPGVGAHIKRKLKKKISTEKRIYFSATTLQQYEDEGFVRSVYRVILRREPDMHGMHFYLNRLRSGTSKVRIIRDLRTSREGRKIGTLLRDITYPSLVEKLDTLPVVRWLASPLVMHYRTRHIAKLASLTSSTLITNANARASAVDSAFQFVLIAMAERDRIASLQNSITRDAVGTLHERINDTSRMIADSAKRAPWVAYDERIRKLEVKSSPAFDHAELRDEIEKLATDSASIHRDIFSAISESRRTYSSVAHDLQANMEELRKDMSGLTHLTSARTPSLDRQHSPSQLRASVFSSSSAISEDTLTKVLGFIEESNSIRDAEIQLLQQSLEILRANVEQFVKERRRATEQPRWIMQGEHLHTLDERVRQLEQRIREMHSPGNSDNLQVINEHLDAFRRTLEATLNRIEVARQHAQPARPASEQSPSLVKNQDNGQELS